MAKRAIRASRAGRRPQTSEASSVSWPSWIARQLLVVTVFILLFTLVPPLLSFWHYTAAVIGAFLMPFGHLPGTGQHSVNSLELQSTISTSSSQFTFTTASAGLSALMQDAQRCPKSRDDVLQWDCQLGVCEHLWFDKIQTEYNACVHSIFEHLINPRRMVIICNPDHSSIRDQVMAKLRNRLSAARARMKGHASSANANEAPNPWLMAAEYATSSDCLAMHGAAYEQQNQAQLHHASQQQPWWEDSLAVELNAWKHRMHILSESTDVWRLPEHMSKCVRENPGLSCLAATASESSRITFVGELRFASSPSIGTGI